MDNKTAALYYSSGFVILYELIKVIHVVCVLFGEIISDGE